MKLTSLVRMFKHEMQLIVSYCFHVQKNLLYCLELMNSWTAQWKAGSLFITSEQNMTWASKYAQASVLIMLLCQEDILTERQSYAISLRSTHLWLFMATACFIRDMKQT